MASGVAASRPALRGKSGSPDSVTSASTSRTRNWNEMKFVSVAR
jgi:hypothetical protein